VTIFIGSKRSFIARARSVTTIDRARRRASNRLTAVA
jgi:hypothetical protein